MTDMMGIGTPDRGNGERPRWRRWARRLGRCVRWGVNAIFLVVLVLHFTPAGYWLGQSLIVQDPLAKADYIVVLGGGKGRAVEGAELYRKGWAEKVIVSEVRRSGGELARVAEAYGVPHERVILDLAPRRTADHPRTIASLGGIDPARTRVIVVTTACHTSRARACFRKAGYRHVCMRVPKWQDGGDYASPHEDWTSPIRHLPAIFHELAAWVMYKLRGWV